jgi:Asp-tRNA(Asn)/Glu-tRNA(Gln) amidotransferase A subunit family amidase
MNGAAAKDTGSAVQPQEWTATEIARRVRSGETSAEEVCRHHLERIRELDPEIHAWACVMPDLALDAARAIDARRSKRPLRPLAGVPVGVKDIFNVDGLPCEMGSGIWKGFTPGNDARTVYNVKEADGLAIGKTVTAEFAVHFLPKGLTVNPHDSTRSPGTSSSGSAAAVSSGMVPLALGTQTAGSIVRPASYCGCVGFKPSFGTVPRTGTLKTTDTLDSIGGFARNVGDVRALFEAIRVRGRDFPYVERGLRDATYSVGDSVHIGYIDEGLWVFDGYQRETLDAFRRLLDELAKVPGVTLERYSPGQDLNRVHELHGLIYDKTLAYYFAEEFEQHTLISGLMYEIIERGRKIGLPEYVAATEEQAAISRREGERLSGYDMLLTPSTAGVAPLLEAPETPDTCLIWTFLGMPAISVPAFGSTEGLPFGLQAVAPRFGDLRLLTLAEALLEPFAR